MFKKIKNAVRNFFKPTDAATRINWSLYGRVWREIGRPHWMLLAAGVICTIVAAASETYAITLIKRVMDDGFIAKNMNSLWWVGIEIILIFGVVKSTFAYAQSLALARVGQLASSGLRRRLFRNMLAMPPSYFARTEPGKILNYYTVHSNHVRDLVTTTILNAVQHAVLAFMMLCLMIYYAPQMLGLMLFLVPAISIPIIILSRKRARVTREDLNVQNAGMNNVSQSIAGIKTIQSFNAQLAEIKHMDRIEDQRVRKGYKTSQYARLYSPILELMISIAIGVALILGGHFITSGTITAGDFIAFVMAMFAAYHPMKKLTDLGGNMQNGLISAEILFKFLDEKPDITDAPNAVKLRGRELSVAFENVSFAYSDADGDVLKNFNLNVPAGTVCALVGESGGGKSTVFNLLERFYEPQRGHIKINGKNIDNYTLPSLRDSMAIVSQDVFLFRGSIADNIKYGNERATKKQVESAARAANAHKFIMEFPKGYDTDVGERGSNLSGGQKQRIAIARAILKDAPILLLDEATSALDTQSERAIQLALKILMKGRTTFVVAHRLSTITDADMICVIKNGKIVEQGTDKTLTDRGGEYAKLKAIQFRK